MSDMDKAVAMFKATAKKAGFYDDVAAPVILKKGQTLLVKTSKAETGKAIRNNGGY